MALTHDFVAFPELTNGQMNQFYFDSPHKQITEDFEGEVVKVHDGDTITMRTNFRDFDFQVRFVSTNAPELSEDGGERSRVWLDNIILNQIVTVRVDKKNRVGKFGRLLGNVEFGGMSINEASIINGMATPFDRRFEGEVEDLNKILQEGVIK